MAEYDLVCDVCGKPCDAATAVVSWSADATGESGFVLTHAHDMPAANTQRAEVRRLVWPNEYLRFATERFGRAIADPEPLRAIIWAIAPFVMRHDNASEMDGMRAASFGQIPGVKPGSTDGGVVTAAGAPAKAKEVEAGK
jgi:hypothetical protein